VSYFAQLSEEKRSHFEIHCKFRVLLPGATMFGASAMHEVFEAVVEPIETPSPPRRDELGYRLRQQSLLGEFGRVAMQTRNFREILQRATELAKKPDASAYSRLLILLQCSGNPSVPV
jgi:hypothetical protein